jgi:protein-disulfide isomerase
VLNLALAAALLPGAAIASAGTGAVRAAPAPAPVERHSPRDGSPFLGAAGAPQTLVFFIDYQCPVCPRAAREMPALVSSFGGALKVEVRHNPLGMHPHAFDAAAAARAAQRQGKFWEYHDLLLESGRYERQALVALAEKAGLDRARFLEDFDDAEVRKGILEETRQAERAGALGTPGFLINGHAEVGWASLAWLQGIVRRHMK